MYTPLYFINVKRACSSVGQSTALIRRGSVVRVHPGPPLLSGRTRLIILAGGLAQLGERRSCTAEVVGSNPSSSTSIFLFFSKYIVVY